MQIAILIHNPECVNIVVLHLYIIYDGGFTLNIRVYTSIYTYTAYINMYSCMCLSGII